MFKNYLSVALRNFKRHFGYSVINIVGLAVGMAVCLLILQYVSYERSYDDFHENGDNIYRLKRVLRTSDGRGIESAYSVRSLGPVLKKDFPEVVDFSRIWISANNPTIYKEARFYEKVLFVDQSFLKMFSFSFIKGDPATALSRPNTVVLSESTAKKYFGSENPVGKVITMLDGGVPDKIVDGIIKDVPENSHIKFNILGSIHDKLEYQAFKHGWKTHLFYTYISLKAGTEPKFLESKIPGIVEQYMGEELRRTNQQENFVLQPLRDIHLYSNIMDEFEVNGNAQTVRFLLIIAFFILVVAWINYINLSTARALDRAKEVGLRKVVGADRKQLVKQFFLESMLLNLMGAVLSIVTVVISIPYYNKLTGNSLSMAIFTEARFWLFFLLIFIIGSFFSGLYPAVVLSSFKPVTVLRGRFSSSASGNMLRKFLVVFQIGISIALIASTLTIYNQVKFMKSRDLGFDKDQVLMIKSPKILQAPGVDYRRNMRNFRTELLRYPQIEAFAFCFHVPGHPDKADDKIWRAKGGPGKSIFTQVTWTQFFYVELLKLRLAAGRGFSMKTIRADLKCAVINEKLSKMLGFESPGQALGDYIVKKGKQYKIIGVVKDYHYYSLRKPIEPRLFLLTPRSLSLIGLRLKTADPREVMVFIKKKWDELLPGNPFIYFFLDEFFDRQYKGEMQFRKTFGLFSLLAVFIACSGLFGLSSYTVLQRTKEVGIRKVFGAEIPDMLQLLSKGFTKLALAALCLSLPLTYWGFSKWLESYTYRIEIGWWFWVIPTLIIIPIILITVSYSVVKVAYTNPVKSLRYE